MLAEIFECARQAAAAGELIAPKALAGLALVEGREVGGQGRHQPGSLTMDFGLQRQALGRPIDDREERFPGTGGIFGPERLEFTDSRLGSETPDVGLAQLR